MHRKMIIEFFNVVKSSMQCAVKANALFNAESLYNAYGMTHRRYKYKSIKSSCAVAILIENNHSKM